MKDLEFTMLATTLSLNNSSAHTCALIDNSTGKRIIASGSGYDRIGRALGDYLTDVIKSDKVLLKLFATQMVAYSKRNKRLPLGIYFDFDVQVKRSNGSIMQIALRDAILEGKWDIEGASCGVNGVSEFANSIGLHFSETYKGVRNQRQINGYMLNTIENGAYEKEMKKC